MIRFKLFVIMLTVLFLAGFASADIIINEIMQNPSAVPDGDGEWFELYNSGEADVDIDGWKIGDADTDLHIIDNGGSLIIAADGYLVLGINADIGTNGGVSVDYEYVGVTLANGFDEVVVWDEADVEIDSVGYDDGVTFPDPAGASMFLIDPLLDNSIGTNWDTSTQPWPGSTGDSGTPGATNLIEQPTVLNNGDFESWIDPNTLDNWVLDAEVGTELSQETVNFYEGSTAAMVSWVDIGAQMLEQYVYEQIAGENYMFGTMAYDNDPSGNVQLMMQYKNVAGDDIEGGEFTGAITYDLDGWQMITVEGIAPEGTDHVRVCICFVDDELNWNGSADAVVDAAFLGRPFTNEYIQTNADDLLGTTVIASGIVTQPNGVIADDRTDAYFQDESGYGIMMYDSDVEAGAGIDRGDEILVIGTVADYFGVTEIIDFTWTELSTGNDTPEPMAFTTGEFIDAQGWEGVWATITGILQNDPLEGSYNLYIDDGSGEVTARINADAALDFSEYSMGDEITLRGVIDIYWDNTQLVPSLQEDIGSVESNLILTATPWNDPTWVGPNGGSFRWDAYVENQLGYDLVFDAWFDVMLPNGTHFGPLELYQGMTLDDGQILTASPLQSVPGYAPGGIYTYYVRVGNYPDVLEQDSFQFAKLPIPEGPVAAGISDIEGWTLTGWLDEEKSAFSIDMAVPFEYVMEEAYPNPFNPTTTISIGLPQSADLQVNVYNITGRNVAQLVKGKYSQGYHNFTFNAEGLSSGIYFVNAVVPGKMNEIRKVVLTK